jgi:mono/diheme cytochrome c family protein
MPIGGALRVGPEAAEALPVPVDRSGPTTHGRSLYVIYCAPCHGMSGRGGGPVAKYYVPVGDLASADVQQHADGWLYTMITNGTDKMPSYAHELTVSERWEIVYFTRSLSVASSSSPALPNGARP